MSKLAFSHAERDLDLVSAIRAQSDLSPDQKQVLIRIYRSFSPKTVIASAKTHPSGRG